MSRHLRCLALAALVHAFDVPAGEQTKKLLTAAQPRLSFTIRVPRPAELLRKSDRFGAPFSAQFSAMAPLFVPEVFLSANSSQVDLEAPVTPVSLQSKTHESGMAFAFTATARDPKLYLQGLGTAGPAEDGVTEYVGSQTVHAAMLGNEVLVTNDRALAAAALQASPAARTTPGVPGDVQLLVPVADLLRRAEPEIRAAREAARRKLDEPGALKESEIQAQRMQLEMQEFLQSEVLAPMDWLGFGLTLDAGEVVLVQTIHVRPDSMLGRLLATQGGGAVDLLAYAPDDSASAVGYTFRETHESRAVLLEFLERVMSGPLGSVLGAMLGNLDLDALRAADATAPAEWQSRMLNAALPALPGKPGLRGVWFQGTWLSREQMLANLETAAAKGPPDPNSGGLLAGPPEKVDDPELPPGTYRVRTKLPEVPMPAGQQQQWLAKLWGGPEVEQLVVPAEGGVLTVGGTDARELLIRVWAQSRGEPVPDARRFPGSFVEGQPHQLAGFCDLHVLVEEVIRVLPPGMFPVPNDPAFQEALAKFRTFFQVPQRLVYTGSTGGSSATLTLRYPLESVLKGFKERLR